MPGRTRLTSCADCGDLVFSLKYDTGLRILCSTCWAGIEKRYVERYIEHRFWRRPCNIHECPSDDDFAKHVEDYISQPGELWMRKSIYPSDQSVSALAILCPVCYTSPPAVGKIENYPRRNRKMDKLFQSILAQPDDHYLKLVYADWLEEQE